MSYLPHLKPIVLAMILFNDITTAVECREQARAIGIMEIWENDSHLNDALFQREISRGYSNYLSIHDFI